MTMTADKVAELVKQNLKGKANIDEDADEEAFKAKGWRKYKMYLHGNDYYLWVDQAGKVRKCPGRYKQFLSTHIEWVRAKVTKDNGALEFVVW